MRYLAGMTGMKRSLLMVLALTLAACPKPSKPAEHAGDGKPDGPPEQTRRVALAWETQPANKPDEDPPRTKVFLAVTDETGASQSHPFGEFTGTCSDLGPKGDAKSVLQCWWAGQGVKLYVVVRGQDVVILRLDLDEAVPEDPMDRREIERITVAPGAVIMMGPAA
jgi:hypothetical protein